LIGAQADFFSLTNDEIHMAGLGVLVFDQLLILVRQDSLLHLELRTIGRYLRPIIAALARIKAQLEEIDSRPLWRHFDRVKMFHLRCAKEVPDTLTERLPPLLRVHQNT